MRVNESTPLDPASALLTLMVQSRGAESAAAREDIQHSSELLERARRQVEEALERATNAEAHAGFWEDVSHALGGDVAAIAGAVAAAALIVASGGTGAPAVLALAAAGLSVGATAGSELGLDPKVCLALGAAGTALGVATGCLGTAAGSFGTVATLAASAGGAATAAGGGAAIAAGQYRGDALDAGAAAARARADQDDAWLHFELALGVLRDAAEDVQRAERAASNIAASESAGRGAIIARSGAV